MVAPERLGGCLQGASWLESSSLSNPSLEGKRFLELGHNPLGLPAPLSFYPIILMIKLI